MEKLSNNSTLTLIVGQLLSVAGCETGRQVVLAARFGVVSLVTSDRVAYDLVAPFECGYFELGQVVAVEGQ